MIIMRGIIFSAGDGGQFDKVLTRDAPNVCCFSDPLTEGCAPETYMGSVVGRAICSFVFFHEMVDAR